MLLFVYYFLNFFSLIQIPIYLLLTPIFVYFFSDNYNFLSNQCSDT
jgi:hypothetical protein